MNASRDAAAFYDTLGDHYDEMTQHVKRLESLRPAMKSLAAKLQLGRVLDLGCGSGAHAIALAAAGVEVTAIDPSEAMIKLAQVNAANAGVKVDFMQATTVDMLADHKSKFDSILCLGNTLPHILDEEKLRGTMAAAKSLLAPGGHLILQLLNYERILAQQERIVGIRKAGARTFVRFYDFNEPLLRFNILTIAETAEKPQHQLISTDLYPWRRTELLDLLDSLQYRDLETAANLGGGTFDASASTDLVIFASS